MDSMFDKMTLDGILISLLVYIVLYVYAQQNIFNGRSNTPLVIHILCILFCIFAFWSGDYYHYPEALSMINLNYIDVTDQHSHLEPLYLLIYKYVDGNYIIFRIVIWGLSYILFLANLKLYNIQSHYGIPLFIAYYLIMFSYGRVSLGITSLFLGYALITKYKLNIVYTLLGGMLLLLSYHAHKSMIIPLCLIPLSFLKFNKYSLTFVVICISVIAILFSESLAQSFLGMETDEDQYTSSIISTANAYYDANGSFGVSTIITRSVQYISITLPVIYIITNRVSFSTFNKNVLYRGILNMMILLILMGVALSIMTSLFSAICYRVFNMAYIPAIIVCAISMKNNCLSLKRHKIIFYTASFYSLYRLIYLIYAFNIDPYNTF